MEPSLERNKKVISLVQRLREEGEKPMKMSKLMDSILVD